MGRKPFANCKVPGRPVNAKVNWSVSMVQAPREVVERGSRGALRHPVPKSQVSPCSPRDKGHDVPGTDEM